MYCATSLALGNGVGKQQKLLEHSEREHVPITGVLGLVLNVLALPMAHPACLRISFKMEWERWITFKLNHICLGLGIYRSSPGPLGISRFWNSSSSALGCFQGDLAVRRRWSRRWRIARSGGELLVAGAEALTVRVQEAASWSRSRWMAVQGLPSPGVFSTITAAGSWICVSGMLSRSRRTCSSRRRADCSAARNPMRLS